MSMNYKELEALRAEYVSRLVGGMDIDSLMDFAYEEIMTRVMERSETELLDEVREYDPELLDQMGINHGND